MDLDLHMVMLSLILLISVALLLKGFCMNRHKHHHKQDGEIISSGCLSLLGDGEVTVTLPFYAKKVSIKFIDDGPSTQPSCMPSAPDSAEVEIDENGDLFISWSVGSVRQLKWEAVGCE